MKKIILILLVLVGQLPVLGQAKLPIIKATSKNVKIRDGLHFKDNFWYIIPETKPDIYYVEFPRKEQKVTFITDKDSISFEVKYGEKYDFIILLNEKDTCYTQIAGVYPNLKNYEKSMPNASDTIPFTLRGNRIYFEGKINGSTPLSIQFDLGAGMSNINHKSVKKVKMDFDNKATLVNSDGKNEARLSTKNEVILGNFKWQNEGFIETKNMENWEDAIVGNSLFLDKIYEIDYDKKAVIIHDKLPQIPEGFKKLPMVLEGVHPLFEVTLAFDGQKYTDWFEFDTGNTSNGIITDEVTLKHGIYDKFKKIMGFGGTKVAFMPNLIIAGYTFNKGTITLEKPHANTKSTTLIGNKILKCFNAIIDNQQGFMYLKPNSLFQKKDEDADLKKKP
jgi:hypothetical protein